MLLQVGAVSAEIPASAQCQLQGFFHLARF